MRDPYTVLGVSKSASEADLKKAFRKLAKAHHPDRNQNDPKAKERFAELNSAYEILGDKEKRARFDRGEIDAEGKPRFQGFDPRGGFSGGGRARAGAGGFEGFHFGFGGDHPFQQRGGAGEAADIFSDIFGQTAGGRARQPMKGQDIEAELTLGLEDLVAGDAQRLSLPTGRTVEVNIPKGVGDGKTIRLKGQGQPSPNGGPAGDLLLTVRLRAHPRFTVDGADLKLIQRIPLIDAVLGGPVRVDTLDGAVDLTLPPMTSSGRNFRLRGKGLPKADGRGDLYVTTSIVLPEGGDDELESLMRKRRAGASNA
ncbi:J domain-containing protein [Terrarubrum flagellatum]|uniref:J domain-containing protein n=1 Tax=Terrirubrum flagellatum TaxID=2895980 RepID=UPI0031455DFE